MAPEKRECNEDKDCGFGQKCVKGFCEDIVDADELGPIAF